MKRERLTRLCCCYFLAVGLCTSLDKLLPSTAPATLVCFPALAVLLIALCARPRLLLLVGGSLGLILLCGLIFQPQWLQMLRLLGAWFQAGLPLQAEVFLPAHNLLRLVVALLVTLLIWLLLRLRTPFWLLLLLCLSLPLGISASGVHGHSRALFWLAAGLLPLAAAASVAPDPLARGRAAALALPPVIVLLLFVSLLLPARTSELRWQALYESAVELQQNARAYYQSWRIRHSMLESYDLREQYHARLGGPIAPDNTRMLLVETDTLQLLKASVYDLYTGYSWEKSIYYYANTQSTPAYQPAEVNWRAVPLDFAAPEVATRWSIGWAPEPGSGHPLADFTREAQTSVTLLHPQESRLFYFGRLTDFQSEDPIEPYIEENSELKSLPPLQNGYRYEFSSLLLDRTQSGFAVAVRRAQEQPLPDDYPISVTEIGYCLQIPLSLMARQEYAELQALAWEIAEADLPVGGKRTDYERAVRLERWLKDNFHYTLTPAELPENQDFVLHFLQTGEGYCTYYASAMVMLSRMIGIPARYVTGYNLQPTRQAGQYEATNATAHAWVELYIEGLGWLSFDPTGQADFTEFRTVLVTKGDLTDREFYDLAAAAEAEEADPVSGWLLALAGLVVLLSILLALRLRRVRFRDRLPQLLTRLPDPEILELYYRDVAQQLKLLGWQRPAAETILAFTRRLGGYLPAQAQRLEQLGRAVSAWRYGGRQPQAEDLQNAAELHRQLELLLRGQVKRRSYYLYRLRYAFKRN